MSSIHPDRGAITLIFFVMLIQYYDRYLLVGRAEQQADSSSSDSGCSFFVSVNPRRNRAE